MFTKLQWEYLSIKTLLMVLYERGDPLGPLSILTNHISPSSNCSELLCFNFVLFIKATFSALDHKTQKVGDICTC